MNRNTITILHWVLVLPVAAGAALGTQLLTYWVTTFALQSSWGLDTQKLWLAKCVSALLMGCVFVTVAWVVAPERKRLLAAVAVGLVAIWATVLMAGAFRDRAFSGWIFSIGFSGLLGAAATFGLGWRTFGRHH